MCTWTEDLASLAKSSDESFCHKILSITQRWSLALTVLLVAPPMEAAPQCMGVQWDLLREIAQLSIRAWSPSPCPCSMRCIIIPALSWALYPHFFLHSQCSALIGIGWIQSQLMFITFGFWSSLVDWFPFWIFSPDDKGTISILVLCRSAALTVKAPKSSVFPVLHDRIFQAGEYLKRSNFCFPLADCRWQTLVPAGLWKWPGNPGNFWQGR